MKKNRLLAALMAGALTLSLAACGGSSSASSSAAASSAGSSDPVLTILDTEYAVEDYAICIAKENTELLSEIDTALQELISDGVTQTIIDKYISGVEHDLTFQQDTAGKEELIMATNATFPPYEYYESDTIVGIDAEIAAAIADKLDRKLTIVDTEFGSIIGGVQTGKYDMGMAGMTVTEERKESVNFTTTYATGIQSIIVIEGSEITSLDDLYAEGAEYIVAVQQDTTGDIFCTDDFGEDRVVRYPKGADAVQALLTGKADCVIIDNEPAKSYVEANNQ